MLNCKGGLLINCPPFKLLRQFIRSNQSKFQEVIHVGLILSVFEQGMIYAIMGLGVYITYKILDFPDLTVDGSFPLGAAIARAT